MNNVVYYLSFFSEGNGFVFPHELPKNYYSPGLFLVEPNQNNDFSYSYTFDAMDGGRRISLALSRANEDNPLSSLYMVKTEHYGTFWFNLESIKPEFRYIGSRVELNNHNSFFVVMTTDRQKLERVCNEFNFYFIGNTLLENDLENG